MTHKTKNIHILPTDKPSRLAGSEYITNVQGIDKRVFKFKLWNKFIDNKDLKAVGYIPHNVYITSDEKIKNDDWAYCPVLKKPVFICLDSILMLKNLDYDSNGNSKYKKEWLKKIILTTGQDLIKDGVQAIDDEFLEWLVKNPSCEWVVVENIPNNNWGFDLEEPMNLGYKIIIPKEEFK